MSHFWNPPPFNTPEKELKGCNNKNCFCTGECRKPKDSDEYSDFVKKVSSIDNTEDECLHSFYKKNEVLGLVCTCKKCSIIC
jgi:hypothetical protein